MNSISETEINKKRITSKTQALIKLIEKEGKDKRFIKNCRPISLLIMVLRVIPKPNPNLNWGGGRGGSIFFLGSNCVDTVKCRL